MDETIVKQLIDAAKIARDNAYSPYSDFQVGAATLWANGKIYTGCNVENASYGLTICAERTAMLKAVSEGERELIAIAVVSSVQSIVRPCGSCLQVISEFAKKPDKVVIIAGCSGVEYDIRKLSEYLPIPFIFSKSDVNPIK